MALEDLQWITCLIYIDDIVLFRKNFNEHVHRVQEVIGRTKPVGLKLKPDRRHLLQKEVIFLDHVVSGEGVKARPVNISKIGGWPSPKTVKQVKQYVAMDSYYLRYI